MTGNVVENQFCGSGVMIFLNHLFLITARNSRNVSFSRATVPSRHGLEDLDRLRQQRRPSTVDRCLQCNAENLPILSQEMKH